jgi:hypothetical protein
MRQVPEATTQKIKKAATTRGVICNSPSTPAAAGAMKTRRFFSHCLGRAPRANTGLA